MCAHIIAAVFFYSSDRLFVQGRISYGEYTPEGESMKVKVTSIIAGKISEFSIFFPQEITIFFP